MNEPSRIPRRILLVSAAASAASASLALTATGQWAAPARALGARPLADAPNASPDGTTIPSAVSITDNGGAVWTVSGGVIHRDGATVGNTYDVTLLLWYGGMVYHAGTGGQWYVCNNDVWLPVTDPRIALAAPAGLLYGVNGHHDTTLAPSDIASAMAGLGASVFRVNTGGDAGTIGAAASIAQYLHGVGKVTFPVIDAGLRNGDQLAYGSESEAFAAAQAIAVDVATAFSPHGVTMYECGNELTRDPYVILPSHEADAGTKAVDFDNTNWPILRGFVRGLIDGIKSVQPTALCGVNFCKSDIGAADALWDGMQPDGSGGHPQVRWDITTWHNYEGDGDVFGIGTDGAGPSFDLPIYVKARYGKPFMMTEWNSDPNQGVSHRASYIGTQLEEFRAHRTTEAFQSAMFYELDGGTQWGLTESDGTPLDPPYTAFQSFVTAHPDDVTNPAPIGETISLRASNGAFVSARIEADGSVPLEAVAAEVDTWEQFTVVDLGGGAIALRAQANGDFVSAWQATADAPLTATVTTAADWEAFRWVVTGSGTVGLLALSNGNFVSTRQDLSDARLQAGARRLLGWEEFEWATV